MQPKVSSADTAKDRKAQASETTKPAVPSTAAIDSSAHVASAAAAAEEITHLKSLNESLAGREAELQLELDGIEKERDFYFDKLRDIEMMLQDLEDNDNGTALTASIFKILYG